jgi:CBS-domain-containing membrane protein
MAAMTVKQLAARDVRSCAPETDLATAAKIMWDCDCGVVPVVTEDRKVVGMVTDRDICIAAATCASRPSDIQVRDVMSGDVATCRQDDDATAALNTMKQRRVRRLPVLDGRGRLAGIISMNDLVMQAECRAGAGVSGEAFLETLKAICSHTRQPVSA